MRQPDLAYQACHRFYSDEVTVPKCHNSWWRHFFKDGKGSVGKNLLRPRHVSHLHRWLCAWTCFTVLSTNCWPFVLFCPFWHVTFSFLLNCWYSLCILLVNCVMYFDRWLTSFKGVVCLVNVYKWAVWGAFCLCCVNSNTLSSFLCTTCLDRALVCCC